MSESTAQIATPTAGHRQLDAFVGRWRTEGVVLAGEHGPETPFTAVDTYEWMDGGFFLLHHVDANMGDGHLTGLEIIGYDPATDTYPAQAYDSRGNTATYRASMLDGVWRFVGDAERFTGSFSGDGSTMAGRWELRTDHGWVPWMNVRLARDG